MGRRKYVAFLTPSVNTDCFARLVPRKCRLSAIFSTENTHYTNLIDASYTLAGYLIIEFGVSHHGVTFKSSEIDYAHVKLLPIHARKVNHKSLCLGITAEEAPYKE